MRQAEQGLEQLLSPQSLASLQDYIEDEVPRFLFRALQGYLTHEKQLLPVGPP